MGLLPERAFIMRMHTGGASLSIYGDQTTPPQSRNARIRTSEQLSYTPHYKAELLRLQGNFSLQHRDRETETHPVLDAARKKKKTSVPSLGSRKPHYVIARFTLPTSIPPRTQRQRKKKSACAWFRWNVERGIKFNWRLKGEDSETE